MTRVRGGVPESVESVVCPLGPATRECDRFDARQRPDPRPTCDILQTIPVDCPGARATCRQPSPV
jgi:hypothetical protein